MKLSIFFLVTAVAVLLLAIIAVSEGTRSRSSSSSGTRSSSSSGARHCKRPSYFRNGRFYFSRALARRTHYKIGSVLEMRCNTGYKLIGSKYLRCVRGRSGSVGWSGRLAICKPNDSRKKCPSLQAPSNGYVSIKGRQAFYGCKNGASLQGNRIRTCQSNGQWAGSKPWCKSKIINCGDPGTPRNGFRKLSRTTLGSIVVYSCKSGFYLSGNSKRKCQSNKQWSGKLPICKAKVINCGDPGTPRNGFRKLSRTTLGSIVAYFCKSGFYLSGDSKRKCLSNRQWSGKLPICKAKVINCGDPGTPRNGFRKLSRTTLGSIVAYSCKSGFYLSGDSKRKCLSNRQWSGKLPICKAKVINCGDPGTPRNGFRKLSRTTLGSIVAYSCKSGFYLSGNSKRKCLSNRQWSGKLPICKAKVINCGDPGTPRNGFRKLSRTTLGSIVAYSCKSGFYLSGDSKRKCLSNRQWSGKLPICKALCPKLSAPSNGKVQVEGVKKGSSARYSCNDGYKLRGDTTRICQEGGQWSGQKPTCQAVTCQRLGAPRNGGVRFDSLTKGSIATYICKNGFKLVGNKKRQCLKTGQWSGMEPICKPIDCGDPGTPENGNREFEMTTVGSIVTYSCRKGYYLIGDRRECLANGQWSGKLPICKALCPRLSAPSNGKVQVEGVKTGSSARYSCNDGYKLRGDTTRICQEGGQWSGQEPTCQAVTCQRLGAPRNGGVRFDSLSKGSIAIYTCTNGFELAGDQSRECLKTGQWSGREPTCNPIDCGDPGTPENGDRELDKTTLGSIVRYSCRKGYYLAGNSERECLANRQWSGKLPTCKAFCQELSAPSNGNVQIEGIKPGSSATYSCIEGYKLDGNEIRICQEGGEWSGNEPICQVTCQSLSEPKNGGVQFTSLVKGSIATYSCFDGFKLIGKVNRQCLATGQWSGEEPTCYPIDCGSLSPPVNGAVDMDGTTAGSIATYSCQSGYELAGVETRECLNSGKWSEEAPTCEAVDCGGLDAPKSGAVELSGTVLGSKATYSCFFSYKLVGVESRECLPSGQWSEEPPTCESIKCKELTNPENGKVKFVSTLLSSIATYSCNDGFILSGKSRRECQINGEWSGTEPSCIEIQCPVLKNPKHGKVIITTRSIGSKAYYTCQNGFRLSGDGSRTCQESGEWSGNEPVCVPIKNTDCKALPHPENGLVIAKGLTVGSRVYYSCDYGYNLTKGSEVRICQENLQWSGTAGICEAVRCRVLSSPANGKVSFISHHFLSEATYSCYDGFELVGPLFRRCEGDGYWTGEDPVCSKQQLNK
ncbi:PREDICTED: sushi, von Willebrand factor type A, EGF and pentraxin domain-containing protein 1-like isoform X2 [Amphimedon queenslandica]|uniref:Sushi domain-containing protein n=1 Tax=Amphimedon queenslandica TaxID=400682 RepID=A0AAN0K2M2_AMPQE|nr:PREDICTED: sushi, von Willebrand factor type A, EGF and pentraxin domain-containing protein 1-like isoform X2 [Amphimedon queenslandica]|eukprot:XP_019863590.1 PREDICTED: sushi, von Willebrand factor type A, EGF and pentraxin domain-containing protein 1-like isoform X2 [Amphimedon queenslandica]